MATLEEAINSSAVEAPALPASALEQEAPVLSASTTIAESKEDSHPPPSLADIVVPIHTKGPPKWKRPLADASKITVTEGPPGVAELFESMVATSTANTSMGEATTVIKTKRRTIAEGKEDEVAEGTEIIETKKRAAPGAVTLPSDLSEEIKPLAERIV